MSRLSRRDAHDRLDMFVFIRRIKQKSGQIGVSHRPSTFGQGVSFNLVIDGSAAIHQSGRRTIVQSVLLASKDVHRRRISNLSRQDRPQTRSPPRRQKML